MPRHDGLRAQRKHSSDPATVPARYQHEPNPRQRRSTREHPGAQQRLRKAALGVRFPPASIGWESAASGWRVSLAICLELNAEDHGEVAARHLLRRPAGWPEAARAAAGYAAPDPVERADQAQERESRYRIVEVGDAGTLTAALDAALDVRGALEASGPIGRRLPRASLPTATGAATTAPTSAGVIL
jgi:hypothetical protein